MVKVGDIVDVHGSRGVVEKDVMGDDFIVRLNNGKRMGAHKRNIVVIQAAASVKADEVAEEKIDEMIEEVFGEEKIDEKV